MFICRHLGRTLLSYISTSRAPRRNSPVRASRRKKGGGIQEFSLALAARDVACLYGYMLRFVLRGYNTHREKEREREERTWLRNYERVSSDRWNFFLDSGARTWLDVSADLISSCCEVAARVYTCVYMYIERKRERCVLIALLRGAARETHFEML